MGNKFQAGTGNLQAMMDENFSRKGAKNKIFATESTESTESTEYTEKKTNPFKLPGT
jgi:hypothetical protein